MPHRILTKRRSCVAVEYCWLAVKVRCSADGEVAVQWLAGVLRCPVSAWCSCRPALVLVLLLPFALFWFVRVDHSCGGRSDHAISPPVLFSYGLFPFLMYKYTPYSPSLYPNPSLVEPA